MEELRGRLTGTKSAPPGVDMTTVPADAVQGESTADTSQENPEVCTFMQCWTICVKSLTHWLRLVVYSLL